MTAHLSEVVWSHWQRNLLCVQRDIACTLRPRWERSRLCGWRERGMGRAGLGADGCAANATGLVALRRQLGKSGKAWCSKNKWKTPFWQALLEAKQEAGTWIQVTGSSQVLPHSIWQKLALAMILTHIWETTEVSSHAEYSKQIKPHCSSNYAYNSV